MLKSYTVCDCCGKPLDTTGLKAVQPIAFTTLPVSGSSSKRSDVTGQDFCSVICLQTSINAALDVITSLLPVADVMQVQLN